MEQKEEIGIGKETVTGTATSQTEFREEFRQKMARHDQKRGKLNLNDWIWGLAFIGFAVYGFIVFVSKVFQAL